MRSVAKETGEKNADAYNGNSVVGSGDRDIDRRRGVHGRQRSFHRLMTIEGSTPGPAANEKPPGPGFVFSLRQNLMAITRAKVLEVEWGERIGHCNRQI